MAGLERLYKMGCLPRHGQVIMIAGRSGSQKSGLALWWTAQMNLPTLYFSADMSAFTASARLASMFVGETTEQIEAGMKAGKREHYLKALEDLDITFSFGSPITWRAIDEEMEAFVELRDEYPQVIVLDNLMDFDGAQDDYSAQMEVMSMVTELSRATGATVVVMHHATDKSGAAEYEPWMPASRKEIKNGLAEKPELALSVALDPATNDFRVAVVKQRMGPQDPTAKTFAMLKADPEHTRFYSYAKQERSER